MKKRFKSLKNYLGCKNYHSIMRSIKRLKFRKKFSKKDFKDFNFYDPLFFPIDNIAPPLSKDELKITGIFLDPYFYDDSDD